MKVLLTNNINLQNCFTYFFRIKILGYITSDFAPILPLTTPLPQKTMDPLDAVLSATVTLAQDLLSEKPIIGRLMPNLLTSPNKPGSSMRLGRRRFDQQSSDDDEDTDLDLLVFARLQKRRRDRFLAQMHTKPIKPTSTTHDDSDSSSSMSDPGVLYPKVSLHEPEVVVNGNRAAVCYKREATGSGSSPFMQYLKGCPDLTFETQFKLSRDTFSVNIFFALERFSNLIWPLFFFW